MNEETQPDEDTLIASPALEFCIRLTRAYAALTRRIDNHLGSLHGLSFADFLLLSHLSRAPAARLRRVDLAERLGLTASGVTRALLPLEKLGLVTREADLRDARIGYALLTDAGKQLCRNAHVSAEELCQDATQAVSADKLNKLGEVMGILAGMTRTGV